MIAAAKLRGLVSELEKLQTAVTGFRLKYNCLPGDCLNATTYFGTADPAGNALANEDGNGKIGTGGGTFNYVESSQFGVHLNAAGLLHYGLQGTTYPAERAFADKGIWYATVLPDGDAMNHLIVGINQAAVNGCESHAVLSPAMLPAEAQNVDAKLDDGLPYTGVVRSNSCVRNDLGAYWNNTNTGGGVTNKCVVGSAYNTPGNIGQRTCGLQIKLVGQ